MTAVDPMDAEHGAIEIVPAPVYVPHPTSGEAVAVIADTPTDVLAELRDAIVEHEKAIIAGWKRTIDEELTRRLDYENTRSVTVGRFKLTVPGATKVAWDGRAAYLACQRLVRAGLISKDTMRRCVERVTDYKPKHGPLTQLAKHADPRVADAIDSCRGSEAIENRRVSVTRTG